MRLMYHIMVVQLIVQRADEKDNLTDSKPGVI